MDDVVFGKPAAEAAADTVARLGARRADLAVDHVPAVRVDVCVSQIVADEDVEYLERWLTEHIFTEDMRLGAFLSEVM